MVATLLDPRYMDKFLNDKDQANKWVVKKWVLCQRNTLLTKKEKRETKKKVIKQTISNEDQSLSKEIHEDIWECFDEIVNKTKEGESESNSCSEVSEPSNSRESSPLQGILKTPSTVSSRKSRLSTKKN